MNALVTGGRGFLGGYVETRLKELGVGVTIYDTADDIRNDVTDPIRLAQVAAEARPDVIIHLAGLLGTHELWDTAKDAIDVNIMGALNVGRVASEHEIKMVSIEQPHIWFNVYEASKFAARRMLTGMHYDSGLQVEFVTAHNAYGPGQQFGPNHPQKIIPTFAVAAWRGDKIPIWGDGNQKVNLVYAGDVADALVKRALTLYSDPHAQYQAGSNRLLTVNEVAAAVLTAANSSSAIEYFPMRRGEQQAAGYPDPTWYPREYPYEFDYSTFAATVRWYEQFAEHAGNVSYLHKK